MGIFISRRWFGFIVFSAHCSYISGGYLSFFLVIYRVHADDVYMLGSLIGGFSSYLFHLSSAKKRRPSHFSTSLSIF